MENRFRKVSNAALALGLLTVGATAVHSNSATEAVMKAAEGDADAAKALAKRKPDVAIRFAEHAVQQRPQDATYRALLGKAYLAGGRFFSAKQAFAEALQLDPGSPGVALNLALVTTATGDFAAAQEILAANAASIPDADRGLAIALAGDPVAAVQILLPAARAVGSDAKTRQNLALAFALAGRWPEARQVALADLSPADADARIMQWAAFARPAAASDQVSALLRVTPVADAGQPVQLALVSAVAQVAAVVPEPTSVAPIAVATVAPAPVVAPAEVAEVAPRPRVAFAARREVVQALPAEPVRAVVQTLPAAPVRVVRETRAVRVAAPARLAPAVAVAAPAKGNFYVQLGAYDSAAMAKWGWNRARARYAVLKGNTPYTMPTGNGLVRVAIGGFDRGDANAMCRKIRAKGGACFVRAGAGDQVASWVNNAVQFASVKAPRGRPSTGG